MQIIKLQGMKRMERVTQLNSLYDMVERLQEKGKIANAFGSCETNFNNRSGNLVVDYDDPDGTVLTDFMEYIYTYYSEAKMVDWMETFYQILSWQFQSMHEGVVTYYENFYGYSEYSVIVRTAEFLQENGYQEIYEQYHRGVVECDQYEYPTEMKSVVEEMDLWINEHTKEVWDFCVDILAKHKEDWL